MKTIFPKIMLVSLAVLPTAAIVAASMANDGGLFLSDEPVVPGAGESDRPQEYDYQPITEDLPALVEADRWRTGEEREKERERAKFVRETRANLARLTVIALAETIGTAKETRQWSKKSAMRKSTTFPGRKSPPNRVGTRSSGSATW